MSKDIYQKPQHIERPCLCYYNVAELMMIFKLPESSVLSLISSGVLTHPTKAVRGQPRKVSVSLEEMNGFLKRCFKAPIGFDFEPAISWEQLLEAQSVQHHLKISRSELHQLLQKKQIPHYKVTRKITRYRMWDLVRWVLDLITQN